MLRPYGYAIIGAMATNQGRRAAHEQTRAAENRAAPATQSQTRAFALPFAIALFVLALLPRTLGLADFLTTDEAYHWIERTQRFSDAIASSQWAATNQTGHPGVTVMWLGSMGLALERWAFNNGWIAATDRLGHLAWLRLGPACMNALALGLGFLLLRRLVRPAIALIAALLWATSPYLVAHGRLLHLDALLTNFVTLSLLATLNASRAQRPLPWLALAGVCTGLALLTKGPALIVLPVLGLVLFAGYVFGQNSGFRIQDTADPGLRSIEDSEFRIQNSEDLRLQQLPLENKGTTEYSFAVRVVQLGRALFRALADYAVVLTVAAIIVVALWPALWSTPQVAIVRYVDEIVGNGGRPNGDGQFFLGQAMGDPGWLFYPLSALYRLSPLETLGLMALLYAVFVTFWQQTGKKHFAPFASLRFNTESFALCALLAYLLFWTLVMTLGPKKFDRYFLPAWPALLVLIAAGLSYGASWLRGLRLNLPRLAALVLAAQLALLAWYRPYYLSYYNPLLGGGRVAQNIFLIGWGEGMDQVGAYLRSRPDSDGGQVLSALPPTLQPFVPVPVRNVYTIDTGPANYAVVYRESLQRGAFPAVYQRLQATVPLHTVRIHGIDYAWIHQIQRPYAEAVGAQFGSTLALPGVTIEQQEAQIVVTPAWDVRGQPAADYTVFLHLYDSQRTRVAQIDIPPGGASLPPSSKWQPGQQISVPLPLPAALPTGDYQLVLGLYDSRTLTRVPLVAGLVADPALAGEHALLLGTVTR